MKRFSTMVLGSLLLAQATPGRAQSADSSVVERMPLEGKLAVGYVSTIAPFGVRWWFDEKWALDTGIGLYDDDQTTIFTYQGGVVLLLESSPSLLLELRPGWSYRTHIRELAFGLTLMVEYFPLNTEKFSLTSGIGPHVKWTDYGRPSQRFIFESLASTLTVLGFHYYF